MNNNNNNNRNFIAIFIATICIIVIKQLWVSIQIKENHLRNQKLYNTNVKFMYV